MMILKVFRIFSILIFFSYHLSSQNIVSGFVKSKINRSPISDVRIYDASNGLLSISDDNGYYSFKTNEEEINIILFSYDFNFLDTVLFVDKNINGAL